MGYGEGAITAWYLSRVVIATVTAPYAKPVPPEAFANAEKRNFIDELVLAKLASLNIPPSPPSSARCGVRPDHPATLTCLPEGHWLCGVLSI